MFDILGLFAVSGAFLVLVASPRPATLAVATISMSAGRHVGLRFGLGLSVGHIFWGSVAAMGLGALLEAAAHFLVFLKILGGMYLLWLAYNSLRSATKETPVRSAIGVDGNWFRRGLFLNLSNPKIVFAWTATLSLGVSPGHASRQVFVATGLCILVAFMTNAAYALAFSTNGAMKIYSRFRRWIEGLVSGLQFLLTSV